MPELQTWLATLRAYRLDTLDATVPLPAARALFWDATDWDFLSIITLNAFDDMGFYYDI